MEKFFAVCLWYGLIAFFGYGALFGGDGIDMGGRLSAGVCALLLIFVTWSMRGG